MTQQTPPFQRLTTYLQTHKIKTVLLGLMVVFVLAYVLAFFIPKQVQFSYAGSTCTRQLTLLPDLHRADDTSKLDIRFNDELTIGSSTWASLSTCFSATTEPKQGELKIGTSPFGSFFARKQFVLNVPEAPRANLASFDKPLPVSKAMIVPMSQPDAVFTYRLANGDSATDCKKSDVGISCDVPKLDLKQGKEYELTLTRQFRSNEETIIATEEVETLRAVTIKKSGVKKGQTIYAKPTSFDFIVDKPLARATAELKSVENSSRPIDVETTVDGTKLTVKWPKQLSRETRYKLTLKSAEAVDGSTFVEPVTYGFTMSGGPKVVSVNVGSTKATPGAPVTVTFDQDIANNSATSASMTGISATPSKSSARTLTLTPKGSARCQDFAVVVKKGIKSKYGIASKADFSRGSRTLCQSVSTIGTSLQGRAIQAYSFGSGGPVTLFTGAIHGNESSSASMMRSLIDHLEAKGKNIPGRVVVVPVVNPDGLTAGTRNNSRNVNISRNFPTDNWKRDIDDTNGPNKGGGGSKPLSEPEARAIANLTTSLRPRLLLSYHAIGSLVVGDPGGYSAGKAAQYAGLVGYRNATGQSGTFDYDITGSFEDWSYRNAGVPSMVIELGSYTFHDFNHHRTAIEAMLR